MNHFAANPKYLHHVLTSFNFYKLKIECSDFLHAQLARRYELLLTCRYVCTSVPSQNLQPSPVLSLKERKRV